MLKRITRPSYRRFGLITVLSCGPFQNREKLQHGGTSIRHRRSAANASRHDGSRQCIEIKDKFLR
ncbi:hypothetical protein AOX55_0000843 [Sinorhizobium fredii CCBAU 25509]|nr:hypothetical protein AOX55_0000843 [Sinorhizobium fredii CCBAU 25509]